MKGGSSKEVLVEVGDGRVEGSSDGRVAIKGAHGIADRVEALADDVVDEILADAEVVADDVAVAGVDNSLGEGRHVLDDVVVLVEHVVSTGFGAVLTSLDGLDGRV